MTDRKALRVSIAFAGPKRLSCSSLLAAWWVAGPPRRRSEDIIKTIAATSGACNNRGDIATG